MDYKNGKGAPGMARSISTTSWSVRATSSHHARHNRSGRRIVCGADTGSPVWDKYKPPFKFTGTLYSTTVDVSGDLIKDPEADMRMALARQ